jgi:hypothetical protein
MGGTPLSGVVPRIDPNTGNCITFPGLTHLRSVNLIPPRATDFTQFGSSITSVINKTDRMVFTVGSATSLRALLMLMPNPPYTVDMALMVTAAIQTSSHAIWGGFAAYDGTKFEVMGLGSNQGPQANVGVQQWTNITTFNGQVLLGTFIGAMGGLGWLRVVDDGTNRLFYTSPNGKDFNLFTSRSRSTWLASGGTHIGIQFYAATAGGPGLQVIYHWKVTPGILGDEP